jgi:hypothetical protein
MPFFDIFFRIGPYGMDHDERIKADGDEPFLSRGLGSLE